MGSSNTAGSQAALNNANYAFSIYNNDYNQWKGQYDRYRQQADLQYARDFGTSAFDYANRANKSGIKTANQQLDAQSRGAVNQAQLAGRAAGLSKGQAAMNAAGVASQQYQTGYGNAVNQGAQMYGQGAQMNMQHGQQQQGNAMNLMGQATQGMQGAIGTQQAVGSTQTSNRDKNLGVVSGIGGIVSGFGSMMGSDVRMKKNIESTDNWHSDFMKRLNALGR